MLADMLIHGSPNTYEASVSQQERLDMEQFMLVFDSDFAPIVGQQITLGSTSPVSVEDRVDLLLERADTPFTSKILGEGYRLGIDDALDTEPLVDSNECTGGDDINATLEGVILVEITCAASHTINVLPFTNVQGSGNLHLIAPHVTFHPGFEAGQLDVISGDPCPECLH